MITVGQLKKELEGVPDNVAIVTTGSDHSYNKVQSVSKEPAEIDPRTKEMWEYYGEGNKNKKSNKVIDVFVIW
jgi:hypothetical protein